MADTNEGMHVMPVDELEARRAVAGLDADIMEQGLPSEEAEAITTALRHFLMGDVSGARNILQGVYSDETVDEILAEFADDTDADVADEAA